MTPLSHPDDLYLRAAIGWLELGDCIEADAELDKITAKLRAHPDVLTLRWRVYAKAGKWEAAFDIARRLTALVPNEPIPWLQQAAALRHIEGGGLEQAFQSLVPVADKFPDNRYVPYTLACYAA